MSKALRGKRHRPKYTQEFRESCKRLLSFLPQEVSDPDYRSLAKAGKTYLMLKRGITERQAATLVNQYLKLLRQEVDYLRAERKLLKRFVEQGR